MAGETHQADENDLGKGGGGLGSQVSHLPGLKNIVNLFLSTPYSSFHPLSHHFME